jgi:hypothetical protein
MDSNKVLRFALQDKLLDTDVSPSNISLPLMADYIKQVSAFLRGSSRTNLGEIKTEIIEGSFAVAVHDETGVLEDAYNDYRQIKGGQDLSGVDPARISVILEWRDAAVSNEDRKYSLGEVLGDGIIDQMFIDSSSTINQVSELWVNTELYVYGRVYDMGGKTKTNVHLLLENGSTIKAETKPEVLRSDDQNRLYKKQLVRISAEQNVETKEIRKERLLSFEHYSPVFDEDQYEVLARRIKSSWSHVVNVNEWVENSRGSSV